MLKNLMNIFIDKDANYEKDFFKNIEKIRLIYPYLTLFETIFRFKVVEFLDENYSDWYKADSEFNKSLLEGEDDRFINKANERLIKNGLDINSKNVMSEIVLGFWQLLFDEKYCNKINLKNIFIKSISDDVIYNKIDGIRKVRNKISHNKSILDINLDKVISDIKEIIFSLDVEKEEIEKLFEKIK